MSKIIGITLGEMCKNHQRKEPSDQREDTGSFKSERHQSLSLLPFWPGTSPCLSLILGTSFIYLDI